jgi:hypothetical protein
MPVASHSAGVSQPACEPTFEDSKKYPPCANEETDAGIDQTLSLI